MVDLHVCNRKRNRRCPIASTLHLRPTKTAMHLAITFDPHLHCQLWKKESPSCPLSGSFQSQNCPLKGFFSLAKRDFLVANGRMAADFSSPAWRNENSAPLSIAIILFIYFSKRFAFNSCISKVQFSLCTSRFDAMSVHWRSIFLSSLTLLAFHLASWSSRSLR